MPEPSFVIGSSFSLLDLPEAERRRLDTAPWVFCCNSFLSHWEVAGFRPSVWAFGDNDRPDLVDQASLELSAIASDILLASRLKNVFLAVEEYEREIREAAASWGIPAKFYRRGPPWLDGQSLADSLDGRIFHCGSTLTDLVNFAAILNPGADIRLAGCEWGDGFGHFYEGRRAYPCPGAGAFWQKVKTAMWSGFRQLSDAGVPLIDCNTAHDRLPEQYRLPAGRLLG